MFARRKRGGQKIVLLTAYDLTSALIAAAGGVDAILVGDSVGMVVLGHQNTLPVTVDDMLHHCRAVAQQGARAGQNGQKFAAYPTLTYTGSRRAASCAQDRLSVRSLP